MRYCVIKNTDTIIDGSDNSDEVMAKNALSSGCNNDGYEILSEEEFKVREAEFPIVIPKTEMDLLRQQIATSQGAIDFILMNF